MSAAAPPVRLRRTRELAGVAAAWLWPPRMSGSQWADRHRVLPASDAEPGPYRTDRFPLIREVQDTLCDETTRKIVLWGPTQAAKTTAITNFIGRCIHHDPGRTLVILPTEDKATEFSTEKLEPMIAGSPALAEKAAVGTARTHRKSVLSKTFPGMILNIRGGNSPNPFSSGSIRYAIADELDRIPPNEEGDPVDLLTQRVSTFWNHKLILASTCTDKGTSAIEAEYELSDQRKPYVPCLGCGHMHVMEWEHIDFSDPDQSGPATPAGRFHGAEDPEQARRFARYRCPACGHAHFDRDKPAMLARVEWRKGNPSSRIAGFWWSALYSPWVSFGQLAFEFRESRGSVEALKVLVNCRLARTWEVKGDRPEEATLAACVDSERARGSVPAGTLALTAGVDVQKTHVYYAIRAWGRNWRSWGVAEGALPRTVEGSLDFLDDVLLTDYGGYPVAAAFVDSGAFTDLVYDYCLRHLGRIFPTKGWESRILPVEMVDLERTPNGRRLPGGMKLVHVNASHWKAFVHDHIRVAAGDPGEWRVHGDVAREWLAMMLGERRVLKRVAGREVWKWEPVKGVMNHGLDAEALAAACAWMPVAVHRLAGPIVRRPPATAAAAKREGSGWDVKPLRVR